MNRTVIRPATGTVVDRHGLAGCSRRDIASVQRLIVQDHPVSDGVDVVPHNGLPRGQRGRVRRERLRTIDADDVDRDDRRRRWCRRWRWSWSWCWRWCWRWRRRWRRRWRWSRRWRWRWSRRWRRRWSGCRRRGGRRIGGVSDVAIIVVTGGHAQRNDQQDTWYECAHVASFFCCFLIAVTRDRFRPLWRVRPAPTTVDRSSDGSHRCVLEQVRGH